MALHPHGTHTCNIQYKKSLLEVYLYCTVGIVRVDVREYHWSRKEKSRSVKSKHTCHFEKIRCRTNADYATHKGHFPSQERQECIPKPNKDVLSYLHSQALFRKQLTKDKRNEIIRGVQHDNLTTKNVMRHADVNCAPGRCQIRETPVHPCILQSRCLPGAVVVA